MEPAGRTLTPRPTALPARALGPDLARGVMLLFVAVANSHYFLPAPEVLGGYPQDGSALDRGIIWLLSTFVDGRAFPLFGLLFGYGVAQVARRQGAVGPRAVRRLLWRRALVLIAVGFVHAVLLYVGDILAAYGVLLLLGAWMVRWPDRRLWVVAAVFFAITALPTADASTISPDGPHVSMLPPDPVTMIESRVPVALIISLLGPIGFLCPFAVGLLAGRRRLLEQSDRHRPLLWCTAVGGITAAVLGAQPISLLLAGVASRPGDGALRVWAAGHGATGTLGGFGYAALLALAAERLSDRRWPLVGAVAAAGQRSMTCYLAQSVVWAAVFTPFLLDLSGELTVATTALLATATWAATVVLASRLAAAGRRGPFEALVRRVTYGPPASSA